MSKKLATANLRSDLHYQGGRTLLVEGKGWYTPRPTGQSTAPDHPPYEITFNFHILCNLLTSRIRLPTYLSVTLKKWTQITQMHPGVVIKFF